MNSIEIKAEIAKLEAEAKQILANANFVQGAVNVYHKILAVVQEREQQAATAIKVGIAKDLTAEASKLESPKT